MNAPVKTLNVSRRAVLKGGAITVGFALAGLPSRVRAQSAAVAKRILDSKEVDAFLAVNGDGTVTLFCGKVDLGQGLRIAMPQIAAEELGIDVDKITFIEGDTALTPDQGRTSGSNGIQRGGVQIRQAAATARKALVELAAQRLNAKAEDLETVGGMVRPKSGGAGISFADLIAGKQFDLKLDPEGAAEGSSALHDRRQTAEAARCPGKMLRHPCLCARLRGAEHAARARDQARGRRRQACVR